MASEGTNDHPVLRVIAPDERIQARARAGDTEIVVTDRRLALVFVPEYPSHEPQVLAVPPEDYPAVAQALVYIGQRLAGSRG